MITHVVIYVNSNIEEKMILDAIKNNKDVNFMNLGQIVNNVKLTTMFFIIKSAIKYQVLISLVLLMAPMEIV